MGGLLHFFCALKLYVAIESNVTIYAYFTQGNRHDHNLVWMSYDLRKDDNRLINALEGSGVWRYQNYMCTIYPVILNTCFNVQELCSAFQPSEVVFLSDVLGIYDRPPDQEGQFTSPGIATKFPINNFGSKADFTYGMVNVNSNLICRTEGTRYTF